MDISVIIPMYNAESSIQRCISSVINQTYKGSVELIIVNDGSTDRSREITDQIVAENKDLRFTFVVLNQENGGVSRARNKGLSHSTGKLIAMLDSDDEWLPQKLERQVQVMKDNIEIDFLGCSRNNEVLKVLSKTINVLHRATVNELLIKMYPQTSTAIFKRHLYEQIGGYNEEMTHAEDGELWIRFCANSNFYYLPESMVITGGGKPSFGHSGLSANLKAMQSGGDFIIKEARRKGLISFPFFLGIYTYSKMKYLRRLLITKIR